MSSAIKTKHFVTVIKLVMLICLSVVTIFLLLIGNFISRGVIFSLVASGVLLYIWRRRHLKSSEYDEIGYWSGLDDFELGIDYHCFHDLDISDDDIDIFSGDFYDSRPV